MFKFNKKKRESKLYAPVIGKSVAIEEVPDETFSMKLMGEGIAFEFDGEEVCAPVSGEILLIADTLRAFGIKDDSGVEVLVHIGLETVELAGDGFTKLKETGQVVTKGEPIIKVDRQYMKECGINMITMMVVTNSSDYQINVNNQDIAVDLNTIVIECKTR